jgi:hypothetical protein
MFLALIIFYEILLSFLKLFLKFFKITWAKKKEKKKKNIVLGYICTTLHDYFFLDKI